MDIKNPKVSALSQPSDCQPNTERQIWPMSQYTAAKIANSRRKSRVLLARTLSFDAGTVTIYMQSFPLETPIAQGVWFCVSFGIAGENSDTVAGITDDKSHFTH